jgi:hypothetical protein
VTITAGTWYHVAISAKSNGVMKIVVNGNETISTFSVGTLWNGLTSFRLGQNTLGNFNYFNGVEIEHARKLNKDQSTLNVSAHYLIDRDGTIYHLVPDTLFARHTIGLNYCSIGIENIGSKELPLTNQQVLANSNLIRYLSKKHQIEYVIGHSEYLKFRKSNLWKETNSNYITYKADPGDQFLIEVRKLIIDLNLKYQP